MIRKMSKNAELKYSEKIKVHAYFFDLDFVSVCVETVEYDVRTDDLEPTRDPICDSFSSITLLVGLGNL